MRIINWDDAAAGNCFEHELCAVTVGVFDGVHRGHRELIKRITGRRECSAEGSAADEGAASGAALTPVIVTFRQNPRRLLFPHKETLDIITLDEKLALFEQAGIAACILIDFSPAFASKSGADFIRSLLVKMNMRLMVIGANFCCGKGGSFNAAEIKAFAETFDGGGTAGGAVCEIVPPVMDAGEPVSSSRIRAALANGDARLAARLLGER
ncbi:MAG: FAD synthetase family protein [Spirochaetaceae bacterium]|jgi:riboflavin kinase/FMN adenylyltransferase|nr:FAD synthetase family protein [Spirochaetaceae bacterium]